MLIKKIFLLVVIIFTSSIVYAENTILYGDLDGDRVKEKIEIEEYKGRDWTFRLKIFKKDKLIFTYDKFDNKPLDNAKIVNFEVKGTGVKRDVLFIIVAECNAEFHVVSHEKITDEEGGNPKTSYIVKKYIAQLQSCY
ncbi:MAG: hypothetical protein ACOCWZ_09875 [Spirochaetota bacterium]